MFKSKSKYETTINDIKFEFDYVRISNDGKMALEFVKQRSHKLSKPLQVAKLRRNHPAYDEMLECARDSVALAPIVIRKGA